MISGLMNRSVIGSSAVGVLAPIVGQSEWSDALGEITNFTKIGGDKHYFTTIPHFNSASQVGKSWMPTRTNQSFLLGQAECDVYTISSTWSIDPVTQARVDEVLAKTGAGGSTIGYMQALAKQGISQRLRVMGLFGLEQGEGLISGSTEIALGNDPANNSTWASYDPDWLGVKLASFIARLDSQMLNTPSEIVMLTSNNVYNELHYKRTTTKGSIFDGSIVSIADYLKKCVEGTGRELKIIKDPILAKADSTKTQDLLLIVAPGIDSQTAQNDKLSVSRFGQEVKEIKYNTCIDLGEWRETTYPDTYQGSNGAILCSATAGIVLRDSVSLVLTAPAY